MPGAIRENAMQQRSAQSLEGSAPLLHRPPFIPVSQKACHAALANDIVSRDKCRACPLFFNLALARFRFLNLPVDERICQSTRMIAALLADGEPSSRSEC